MSDSVLGHQNLQGFYKGIVHLTLAIEGIHTICAFHVGGAVAQKKQHLCFSAQHLFDAERLTVGIVGHLLQVQLDHICQIGKDGHKLIAHEDVAGRSQISGRCCRREAQSVQLRER